MQFAIGVPTHSCLMLISFVRSYHPAFGEDCIQKDHCIFVEILNLVLDTYFLLLFKMMGYF